MKGNKAAILALSAGLVLTMSGCSFSDLTEKAVDLITDTAVTDVQPEILHSVEPKDVDKTLALPAFNNDIAGASIGQAGLSVTLDGTATASDGGMLTYQWYRNTVESNGGGTAIEGATDPIYEPDTTEEGSTFYYVVAVNNHGDKVNMTTSSVHEVEIWGVGTWQQNAELGTYQYVLPDDRYPTALSMEIDGVTYIFDEDGYVIDEDGNYIDIQTGEPILEEEPVETPAPTPEPEPEEEAADETAEETAGEDAAEGETAEEEAAAEGETAEGEAAAAEGE